MGLGMFIIGFVIFLFYVYFLIWNIFYSNKKQRDENNYGPKSDELDSDGMGDFTRFPDK
ncbi:MAG: hypothetical protein ACKVK4_09375 [Flavobacteriales bacterium]|jgi:uncharacterized membrane protein|nr:hypothetical protein [Flavobacteriaceae bacterium]|tara:strand:- start:508 stop:684 length:177 start_codon:yes stop_codon:yes gene_type:complete